MMAKALNVEIKKLAEDVKKRAPAAAAPTPPPGKDSDALDSPLADVLQLSDPPVRDEY
jgi:hypothetical protein